MLLPSSDSSTPLHSPIAACLSILLPGLGQFTRGYSSQTAWILATGAVIGIGTWGVSLIGGAGAGIFLGILVLLPWWCLQAYGAYLPSPQGQIKTLKIIWQNGHDIRYLGGLFLLTACTDLYIILLNPDYGLTVWCSKPSGLWGLLAKAQSPILHILIGYGFLRLQRWALFVYLGYASLGMLNAAANYACLGFGRIRTVFFFSLLAFTTYVIWRRKCFNPRTPSAI